MIPRQQATVETDSGPRYHDNTSRDSGYHDVTSRDNPISYRHDNAPSQRRQFFDSKPPSIEISSDNDAPFEHSDSFSSQVRFSYDTYSFSSQVRFGYDTYSFSSQVRFSKDTDSFSSQVRFSKDTDSLGHRLDYISYDKVIDFFILKALTKKSPNYCEC